MSEFKDAAMDEKITPPDALVAKCAGRRLARTLLPRECPVAFDPSRDVCAEDKADLRVALQMVGLA